MIANTINPFTCFRDLAELDALIDTRARLMSAISEAHTSRAEWRFLKEDKDIPSCILDNYEAKFKNHLRRVLYLFDEYRLRCQYSKRNIVTATEWRNKLIEYIEDY